MKIGLLSDTHRRTDLAIAAMQKMGAIDLLLHAGDHYQDAVAIAQRRKVPFKAVVGNCDPAISPTEEVIDIHGHKILLVHGHRLGVKSDIQRICYYTEEKQCDIVVFGHSHVPLVKQLGGIWLINPGSLAQPRDRKVGPSYGLLLITEQKIYPEIIPFQG